MISIVTATTRGLLVLASALMSQSAYSMINPNLIAMNQETSLNLRSRHAATAEYISEINVYRSSNDYPSLSQISELVRTAQEKLDKCGIDLRVRKVVDLDTPAEFRQWETFEFNSGIITSWEKSFFSLTQPKTAGVLFVDSLDWTTDDDGIVAAAYFPGALDSDPIVGDDKDQAFFTNKMQGYSVLGRAANNEMTFVHELGHSLLNLKHNEDDPENMMFAFKKYNSAEFSQEQCESGRQNYPYVRAKNKYRPTQLVLNEHN